MMDAKLPSTLHMPGNTQFVYNCSVQLVTNHNIGMLLINFLFKIPGLLKCCQKSAAQLDMHKKNAERREMGKGGAN